MKYEDISNIKKGSLLAIRPNGFDNRGCKVWLCKCDCGQDKNVIASVFMSGSVKSCGCRSYMLGSNHHNWTGYKDISGRIWNIIKKRARTSKKDFNISIEYGWRIFNGKCSLTGMDINFPRSYYDKYTASLDRIDSNKGYIEGNVWWIHHDINIIKWDWTLSDFFKVCRNVCEFDKSKIVIQKEIKDVQHSIWSNILYKSKERKISVEIDYEYVNNKFKEQGGLCYISGLPLINHCRAGKRTASLDRIDNTKPYVKGNVAWCHKKINSGKNNFTLEYYKELCKKVINNERKHIEN